MAQFAVHVATGIYSGDIIQDNHALKYALIIGNILPDLDFIPLILLYPFNPEVALSFHRSFTHNFFLPLLILGVLSLVSFLRQDNKFKSWGKGLAIGISTHIILDILFWFDQVQVLWPLDVWGISTSTDLWGWLGIVVPDRTALLISPSMEFMMYALFYYFFGKRVQKHFPNHRIRFFPNMVIVSLIVYFGLVVGVFILPAKIIVEISYGLGATLWGTLTIFTVWKYRSILIAKSTN